MTQFYLAVLRRLRETVRKKRPPLSGKMSGFFTTRIRPHKHSALGPEFLASNRTPVVISALLKFYAAYYSSFVPTIRDNLSLPSSRISKSRKPLKTGPSGCPEATVRNYHSTFDKIPKEGRFHLHPGRKPEIMQNSSSYTPILQ
jgi:hypothetical protein